MSTSQAFTSVNGRPLASGIELVPTRSLPDRVRSMFNFAYFNAMQSRSFATAYESSDNFVLSAPTGSGKTAIFELAICRCVAAGPPPGSTGAKIVYTAPTKALCAERKRDWASKLSALGLRCEELTGDTEAAQLRHVQSADVIVTTPEKWDSVTRRWRDHHRLMNMIRLFLVDEVHILKEDRGACLETVVSRMKSMGNDIRFVALSATIPNSLDIAKWLGRSTSDQISPAAHEVFDDSFRPVPLEKHVVGISSNGSNDFSFDQTCTLNLPDVIGRYSKGKPMMIFCMTRTSAMSTAKALAGLWQETYSQERLWPSPSGTFTVLDEDLQECVTAGVAYHHAGMDLKDRDAVQRAYLNGHLSIICCTSTLAVGVNMPCHLVIIKNTVSYNSATMGCQEYSELDVMQMLGRAGRPQFDRDAVAVILTRQEKVNRYQRMVQGQEILESRLHLNLIEHLNAEIGLRTIHDLQSACTWLKGTFFFVRLPQNPRYYRVEGDTPDLDLDSRAEEICKRAIHELDRLELIDSGIHIRSTRLGDAMSMYCVCFETMKLVTSLSYKAKLSEILSVIAQAAEFKSVRLKGTEKALFREINQSPLVKFPIKVNLDLPAQKISLIIQAVLCGLDVRNDQRFSSQKRQYNADIVFVFQHAPRLAKCIVDCQLAKEDSEATRNAMELSRSLGAHAWDDSPLQLAQIEQIGPVAVRKLASAGIRSIEDLENTEPSRIEMALSRNPPFGFEILSKVDAFPKLHVSMKCMGKPVKTRSTVDVHVKAELGYLNETPPASFKKSPLKISFLAETSNGRVVHFCRMSGRDLGSGHDILFDAKLDSSHQLINGYIACDDLAGTLRYATLNPKVPAIMFEGLIQEASTPASDLTCNRHTSRNSIEEYDKEFDDEDLSQVMDEARPTASSSSARRQERASKMTLAGTGKPRTPTNVGASSSKAPVPSRNDSGSAVRDSSKPPSKAEWKPERLPNGNWKCSHRCKNKSTCAHKCCREGTENKPKPPKAVVEQPDEYHQSSIYLAMKQRQDASAAIRQQPTPAASNTDVSQGSVNHAKKPDHGHFEDIDDLPEDLFEDHPDFMEMDSLPATQDLTGLSDASNSPLKEPPSATPVRGSDHQQNRERPLQNILAGTKRKIDEVVPGASHDVSKRVASFHPEVAFVDGRKRFLLDENPQEEPSRQPLKFSDVDFGPACVSDEDLFPERHQEARVQGTQQEQEDETRIVAPIKQPLAELDSSAVNKKQVSCSKDALQKAEVSMEEIDAWIMKEYGDFINLI